MPKEKLDLGELVTKFMKAVEDYGLQKAFVEEYRTSCNSLLKFAKEQGHTQYSPELWQLYSEELDHRVAVGDNCKEYRRFKGRVLRMLASLAETGSVDFSSTLTRPRKYPVSDEFLKLIEDILNYYPISEKTKDDLRVPIRHLFWFANEHGVTPDFLDDNTVMLFLIREVPVTNGGSTGRTLCGIKYATEYLKKNGNRNIHHDYTRLTLKNDKRRIIPAFTEEEISDITRAAKLDTPLGKRDYAIVLLGYCTGLRGADIVLLKLTDIDWRNHLISLIQSKTHSAITVELNGTTMNALADYILDARPECSVPQVFITTKAPYRALSASFASMIDKYCMIAGVKKIPFRAFHSLRRSFETVLASNGVPIETVSQMVGHKSISEDKPYITHDKEKAAFVALDFSDVPIRHGIYARVLSDGNGGSI